MFDDYVNGLRNQLMDQPEVEAELRHAFGCSYLMLGVPDQAEPHFKRAIELRRKLPGPPTEGLAESLAIYGMNRYLQGRHAEAEPALREALEIYHWRGVRGTMPISVCGALQLTLAASGRHDDAEGAIRQAWAEMQGYDELPPELAQSPYSDIAGTCAGFAYYYSTIGKQDEAAEYLRRATLAQQRLRNSFESLGALQFLAATRLRLGDVAGYREACAILCVAPPRAANVESPYIPYDDFDLGRIWTCCLGPNAVDDPSIMVAQAEEFAAKNALRAPYVDANLLGAVHFRAGHLKEAAQYFEQSIVQYPTDPPPSHGTVLWPRLYVAMTKWQLGEHDNARRALREIQPALGAALDAPTLQWQYRQITEVLRREAEALIEPKEPNEAVRK
jgi:tetratricopeptide (TPR) repeat protein